MGGIAAEKIIQICTAAAAAPSGDNSQPWRFVFRAPATIEFHAVFEKDNALLNIDQSGTLIALGAAIQNAELEAKSLGFAPELAYSDSGSLVAMMTLREGGSLSQEERPLREAIPFRHSNRKSYKNVPLTDGDRTAIIRAAGVSPEVALSLIEKKEMMRPVSRALTTMEQVALQNKALHELFFESIFWSKKQNDAGESGLYIYTLELPPPARLLFKILKYWPVAHALARIGFPKLVAQINAAQNATASAFGVLSLTKFDRRGYVEAGRMLERVWLSAAARGMSLQIVTGMLFLARTIERGEASVFSATESSTVQRAYAQAKEMLGIDEPFLMFRVGYASAPTAVSFRRKPEISGVN